MHTEGPIWNIFIEKTCIIRILIWNHSTKFSKQMELLSQIVLQMILCLYRYSKSVRKLSVENLFWKP